MDRRCSSYRSETMPIIDWTDEFCPVTDHFTVRDCLWLGKLGRLAKVGDGFTDEIAANLIETCEVAEHIRVALKCPMRVTSMYRPPYYSVKIGGSVTDVHTHGIAIDFQPVGIDVEEAKKRLRPHLAALRIRMERGTINWVHCDLHEPGPSGREFIP